MPWKILLLAYSIKGVVVDEKRFDEDARGWILGTKGN